MRPSDRVDERGRPLAPGVRADGIRDLCEHVLRHAADPLDHLRRISREVALEDLEDAARMLERLVDRRRLAVLEATAMRAVGLLAPRAAACLDRLLALAR